VGPAVIFENEDAQIDTAAFAGSQAAFVAKTNPDWGGKKATSSEVKNDAVFFFSAGKYNLSCKTNNGTHCGGSPQGGATNALGQVNGVTATEANILDDQFPVDRYLYNVYSDGLNPNIPEATAATLNYVSEIGFLCNPNKGALTAVLDPNTGTAYISEIQSIILASGFYPLSAAAQSGSVNQTPFDEGSPVTPASQLLADGGSGGTGGGLYGYSDYKPYDTYAQVGGGNTDPSGFCTTFTTDNNTQQ